MNLNSNNKDFVLICGDTHDNNKVIPDFLKKYEIINAAIFHVGDFGIGWDSKEKEHRKLKFLSERLAISNSHLFVSRGNHDDPIWFKEYFSTGYIHLLPDYSIITLNGQNFLTIGGATSVDRSNRKEWLKMMGIKWWLNKKTRKGLNRGWWKDEVVVYNDMVETVKNIDVVISHTAPSFSTPYLKDGVMHFALNDSTLIKNLYDERQLMSKIYDKLSENNHIKNWYYGHFHKSNVEMHLNTKFQLLDIDEIVEHRI